jgi:catechol 2,3-dioxygenase-like lactoylglutathione lyase family enzyme
MSMFHLSLDVTNIDASVAFFKLLLGCDPVKAKPDYAKFEPGEPPVILSLEKRDCAAIGRLNHAGIRVADSAKLVDVQRRLEEAGVRTIREDGVECCYAKQTKFWARDPDGTLWEVYVLEKDISDRGVGHLPVMVASNQKCCH